MLRKTLFWGLTLMLVAIIVSLVIRSRREEKSQAPRMSEIVQASKPTATRVVAPQDLEVVEAKMKLVEAAAKEQKEATAHHEVVVRNSGSLAYDNMALRFTYLGRGDKVLESRIRVVSKPVPPGQTASLGDIVVEDVPAGAINCTVKILYADLAK